MIQPIQSSQSAQSALKTNLSANASSFVSKSDLISPTFQNDITQDTSIPVTVYTGDDQMNQAWRNYAYETRMDEYDSRDYRTGIEMFGNKAYVYDISNFAKEINVPANSGKVIAFTRADGTQTFRFRTKNGGEMILNTNYPADQPMDSTTFKNVMGKAIQMASAAISVMDNNGIKTGGGICAELTCDPATKKTDLNRLAKELKNTCDFAFHISRFELGHDVFSADDQNQYDQMMIDLTKDLMSIINEKQS